MGLAQKDQIRDGVLNMLRVNMGMAHGEKLLVVGDIPASEQWLSFSPEWLGRVIERSYLARAVGEIAGETFGDANVETVLFPCTGRSAVEPPPWVTEKMAEADVAVAITSYSLSHTAARENACRAGARMASMPGFLAEMFFPGGPMTVDYDQVASLSRQVAEAMSAASTARVTTPLGTDLRFSLKGRRGNPDTGVYTAKGAWGNLPAGEAYIAPVEGTGEGVLVVPAGWHPNLTEQMVLHFEAGQVIAMEGGGEVGRALVGTLGLPARDPHLRNRRNLAELGVGTNAHASRIDVTLESEKILGTIHIAVGDNSHFGGLTSADYHCDLIIPQPNLELDGVPYIHSGRLVGAP